MLLRCLSSSGETLEIDDMTGWTVKETLQGSLSFLQEADAPEPESSVTQLLASALNLPWSNGFVLLRDVMQSTYDSDDELATRTLTLDETTALRDMLSRRADKEPLQYILGKWDFLDYTFVIRRPLLCPRPETEELVLKVVEDCKQLQQLDKLLRILDIGCGTGAIGVSLASMLPNCQVTAIDIDEIAVQTSNDNAKLILGNVGVERYQALLSSARDFTYHSDATPFDVIVSNPPYIPECYMPTLSEDVVRYESKDALCGGEDGMNVIRDIVYRAAEWGRTGTVIWMEVDPTHPKLLQEWLDKEGTFLGVVFDSAHQDLYGRDRFVKLKVV